MDYINTVNNENDWVLTADGIWMTREEYRKMKENEK